MVKKKISRQRPPTRKTRKVGTSTKPILDTRTKKFRLILLTSAFALIGVSFFLPKSFTAEELSPAVSGSFASEPVKVDKKLLGAKAKKDTVIPRTIIISSISVDIPVKEARVLNGFWEVFADSAGHGEGSANPGEAGNQVIFAHARKGLFIDLPKVKLGDAVYVLATSGWYRYKVTAKKEVSPNQVEVIAPTAEETLTLYTCSGFVDTKRLILIAKRVSL